MTVIKDVLIGGVQTSFDTVLHDLTGSGWRLKLLDLNDHTKRVMMMMNIAPYMLTKSLKEGRRRGCTFILKKVILVRRSTVDLRSCSLSGLLAGKLFCSQTKTENTETLQMISHPSLSRVVFISVGKIQHSHTISTATKPLHLLLCGCTVSPERVCACFRGAVTLINTSTCSVSLFPTRREVEAALQI